MKCFKILFLFLFIVAQIRCGGNNESEENKEDEISLSNVNQVIIDTSDTESYDTITKNSTTQNSKTPIDIIKNNKDSIKNNFDNNSLDKKYNKKSISPSPEITEIEIHSPLRNLLNNAKIGKSYTQEELIENYKFPEEAVNLIKMVTCVGQNKLYFKWGSTWIVEKVSDAKFKNDTLIFTFKQNKTYISGGAIGIKYNKKIYTDLIFSNGAAYIPTVKGYHWDIGK